MAIKIPEALIELLQPYRHKVFYGGRGAAKSRSYASILLSKGVSSTERILCCREIQRSINDSVKRLLDDEIRRCGFQNDYKITKNSIEGVNNDSLFLFAGLRTNIDSIKSMEGITICWIEEAHTVSQDSIDILIPTIREDESELWWSFNAKLKTDPVYKMFIDDGTNDFQPPPNSLIRKVNYPDNPFFPDVLRQEMEWDKKRDPDKYKHIWEGFPVVHSEEQVFFGKWRIDETPEPPEGMALYFGSDFGFSNDPTTLVRFWIEGTTLYIDYEAYGVGVELDEIPQLYDSIPGSRKWKIKADSARPDTISYLRRKGFKIEGAKKGKGSIEDGVERLKNYNIVVHPRCKHTIDELTLYSYKKDKLTNEILPIIVDANNHIIDPLRYGSEGIGKSSFLYV